MTSLAFVGDLLLGFHEAVGPLRKGLSSTPHLSALLDDLGWALDPTADLTSLDAQLKPVRDGLDALDSAAQALAALAANADANSVATAVEATANALKQTVSALRDLESVTAAGSWPAPFSVPAFWAVFAEEVLSQLLCDQLSRRVPLVYAVMVFLGVITEELQTVPPPRLEYMRRTVNWRALPQLVSDPSSFMRDVYGWGTDFHHGPFIDNLAFIARDLGRATGRYAADDELLDVYYDPGVPGRAGIAKLSTGLYWLRDDSDSAVDDLLVDLELVILPIPPTGSRSAKPAGLAIFPWLLLGTNTSFDVAEGVKVTLSASMGVAVVRVEVRPDGAKVTTDNPITSIGGSAVLAVERQQPIVLVGSPNSTRFEIGKLTAGITVAGTRAQPEVIIRLAADAAAVVLEFGDGDGFLRTILGSDPQRLNVSSAVSWSNRTGFGFEGQATLEANLPVHLSIAGVIEVDGIHIGFRASGGNTKARLEISATAGLTLGPVAATIDRVGMSLLLTSVTKPDGPGNFGDLNLGFGFKAPNGLGLSVDAGVVVGGGYIFCDPDKGEYAGVLELSIEVVQVKIIGILNTILPGGQQGFSLLLIVSAEFEPIQLSFGFTLSGVGGLAGINRTMVLEALRTGLKHHTLNSILFPVDPVAHAAQIISDLQTVFPPQQNRYVFGPMIELGWGTPNLIIAELGVVIELPAPIRLAILGQMTAALPKPAAPVVVIHLDVLGTVEFEKKFLSIDATLYDSRVTVFSLLGDMAMRLLWGANANFALSVGGLHPKYQPPPAFPSLTRLTLSMGSGDNPRLSCEAYFAVTSNSLQFGAGLTLYASAAGFTLEGHLGFDALFVFAPVFHFSIEISGSIDLKQGNSTLASLTLDMLLEGPNPFHAAGSVSLHILFITISAGFDATWGDPTTVSLPGKNPKEDLLGALNDVRNWNATIPTDAERAASFVAPAPDNKTVVVHPLGNLGVVQKVVPLGFHMTRYGSAAPIGVDRFDVSDVTLNGTSLASTDYHLIPESFSPGQFENLSENDKLSRASFEPHSAGVQLTSNAVVTGTVMKLDVEYETILVDDPHLPGTSVGLHTVDAATFLAQTGQGAAQFSELRNTGKRKFLDPDGPDGTVRLGHVKYTVSSKTDLSIRRDIADDGNFSSVQQSMDAYLRKNPAEREDLQVTPSHQTARV